MLVYKIICILFIKLEFISVDLYIFCRNPQKESVTPVENKHLLSNKARLYTVLHYFSFFSVYLSGKGLDDMFECRV